MAASGSRCPMSTARVRFLSSRRGGSWPWSGHAPTSGEVTVGLRAEDLRVAAPGDDALLFRLDYVEELGSQRLVHGHVGDQVLTAAMPLDVQLHDEMRLAADPRRLHFFSRDTGKRIELRDAPAVTPQPALYMA